MVQSNLPLQRSNCISCIFERRKAGETCKTCSRDQSANRQDHDINNVVIMLNEINERKPGLLERRRRRENYKFRRQNLVLRAIFFCMVTALSIYSALLQLIEYEAEPLILPWYKAQFPPGPEALLTPNF